MMKEAFQDECMSYRTVYQWHKEFSDGQVSESHTAQWMTLNNGTKENINTIAAIICIEQWGNHCETDSVAVSAINSFLKHHPQAEFGKTISVKWKRCMQQCIDIEGCYFVKEAKPSLIDPIVLANKIL